MTSTQVAVLSAIVIINNPSQDYTLLHDHTSLNYHVYFVVIFVYNYAYELHSDGKMYEQLRSTRCFSFRYTFLFEAH